MQAFGPTHLETKRFRRYNLNYGDSLPKTIPQEKGFMPASHSYFRARPKSRQESVRAKSLLGLGGHFSRTYLKSSDPKA